MISRFSYVILSECQQIVGDEVEKRDAAAGPTRDMLRCISQNCLVDPTSQPAGNSEVPFGHCNPLMCSAVHSSCARWTQGFILCVLIMGIARNGH